MAALGYIIIRQSFFKGKQEYEKDQIVGDIYKDATNQKSKRAAQASARDLAMLLVRELNAHGLKYRVQGLYNSEKDEKGGIRVYFINPAKSKTHECCVCFKIQALEIKSLLQTRAEIKQARLERH